VADPLFADAERGDFRVKDGSPALKLGFRNFAMDNFGVRKPELRALARTPRLPEVRLAPDLTPPKEPADTAFSWRGARIRAIEGEEFSAYGVARESGGIAFSRLPENSRAFKDGFRAGDLIQSVNGQSVRGMADFVKAVATAPDGQPVAIGLVRGQAAASVTMAGPVEVPRL
jgi:membrane-associated protease RseP (regulator of RpoE activity)